MQQGFVAFALFGSLVLTGCGGGSASQSDPVPVPLSTPEVEPNDTPTEATPLPLGVAGVGDVLATGDADYWSFDAQQDEVICVEVFAVRFDQAGWDAADNTARVRLFGPPNGAMQEMEHRFTDGGWQDQYGNRQDYDIARFRIPAAGTYFVCVQPDVASQPGGRYVVRLTKPAGFDDLQAEAEPQGVTGLNDLPASAEPVVPGVVHGFCEIGDVDYYTFTITQPSVVELEVCANRNGRWRLDPDYLFPYLMLFDTDGTSYLAENGKACYRDPKIVYRFLVPGTYYLQVSGLLGSGASPYLLTYTQTPQGVVLSESEPNDAPATADVIAYGETMSGVSVGTNTDYVRFEGQAGDLVEVLLWNWFSLQGSTELVVALMYKSDGVTPAIASTDNVGVFRRVHGVLDETGTYYLAVQSFGAATSYYLQVRTLLRATPESEPNDQIGQEQDLSANPERAAAGLIAMGDVDRFTFGTTPGEFVCLDIWASVSPSFAGFFFNGTLEPQVEVGQLPPWLHQASSLGEPLGTKGCDNPPMTCCFIATGASETVTVSRQQGAADPDDVYVIRRR